MIKKILAIFVLLAALAFGAYEDAPQDGTSAHPWQIANATDWALFVTDMNETVAHRNDYVIVTADINFAGATVEPVCGGNEWAGNFDGQNHTFSNLVIAYAGNFSSNNHIGLFAKTTTGLSAEGYITIENLNITNATVVGTSPNAGYSSYCGILFGENSYNSVISNVVITNPTIQLTQDNAGMNGYVGPLGGSSHGNIPDCYSVGGTAKIEHLTGGTAYLGGLVGLQCAGSAANQNSWIKNCGSTTVLGHINSGASDTLVCIGGITGSLWPIYDTSATPDILNYTAVFDSVFAGTINYVSGGPVRCGGIVAEAGKSSSLGGPTYGGFARGCDNLGTITITNTGTTCTVGGIVGNAYGGLNWNDNHCVGNITVTSGTHTQTGGLAGLFSNSAFTNSSYTGTITMSASGTIGILGGCFGALETGAYVDSCYALVNFSTGSSGLLMNVGGFAGMSTGAGISNCFARGTVLCSGSSTLEYNSWGGLISQINGGYVSNCYAVFGLNTGNSALEELLIGLNTGPTPIYGCFGNTTVAGFGDTPDTFDGIAATTTQMQTKSTYENAGWDFSTTTGKWEIKEGSYPELIYPYPKVGNSFTNYKSGGKQ